MPSYQVVVGNIGTVEETDHDDVAQAVYQNYVNRSVANIGRAAGEDVTLFCDGEIIAEHYGSVEE